MNDRSVREDFERIRLERGRMVRPDHSPGGGGTPAFVGRVTSSASSIAVGKFLLVQPSTVLGDEAEGASGNFTAASSATVAVYLIGPGLPSPGDYLVCKYVDNRWVAERTQLTSSGGGGGTTGTIPSCFCTASPETLTMTSGSSTCNFGMFQSCTIQYGLTPAVYAPLDLDDYTFISLQSFPDVLSNGALFQYQLTCQYNQFSLTRLFPTSPFGSPFRDGVLYTWFVGSYGNTCTPFHLDNGTAFPGSDLSCFVTIDA